MSATVTYERSLDLLRQRLASKPGVSPMDIIAIIQAVLTALSGALSGLCPKPPTPASLKDMAGGGEGNVLMRLSIRRNLVSEGFPRLGARTRDAVEGVLSVINESSEDEVKAFMGGAR